MLCVWSGLVGASVVAEKEGRSSLRSLRVRRQVLAETCAFGEVLGVWGGQVMGGARELGCGKQYAAARLPTHRAGSWYRRLAVSPCSS